MDIKIIMHSQLDVHLKPDYELIKQAINCINLQEGSPKEKFFPLLDLAKSLNENIQLEEGKANLIKSTADLDEKTKLQAEKKQLGAVIDSQLTQALSLLAEAGGGDLYHYNYDLHYNRVVAGLMGSTCYMKDTFAQLQQKGIKNILAIASTVENNGHHSTFGHSFVTLEISGIPKALAMVLNNEKEYCTSEKSARYTVMDNLDPKQLALFEKWKDILSTEIAARYGDRRPFFDEKGTKVGKLAQENARYMISVFTPSNMVYTTSFRQLDYIAHWFEDVIRVGGGNEFYARILPQMQQFVDFVKENNLYSPALEDHKGRKLSLFGSGILKEVLTSSVYTFKYDASLACLAQLHRHRTVHYNIDEFAFKNGARHYYLPPILNNPDKKELQIAWFNDILSVSDQLPQGTLVPVIEYGQTSDFLLKAYERVCVCAQKEIRDLTQSSCFRFAGALGNELDQLSTQRQQILQGGGNAYDLAEVETLEDSILSKQQQFENLSKGARCTAGYQCTSPCKFAEGITLQSEV